MSEKKPFFIGALEKNKNPLIFLSDATILKDTMIFFGWIISILIIAGVCWFLTQPLRNRLMVRAVNRVLAQSGDSRRLTESLYSERRGSLLTGSWFTMYDRSAEGKKVIVFSFIGDGTFFPCAAVMTRDGKLMEFIPLNSHGERILKRTPEGILNIYARRIEGAGS